MNARLADHLLGQLDDRDLAILRSLERFRLLSTRHVQQLHFDAHASPLAAARACTRTLQRLARGGFITPLSRRIGGVRKGSASYIWHLAATGERLLRVQDGRASRRRYQEPGLTFLAHTIAVNDVAVGIIVVARSRNDLTAREVAAEPANWRRFLGPHGETTWLKPDLSVVLSGSDDDGAWDEHAFLEIDRGTEHLGRIQAKCRTYAAYYRTGAYQAEHDVFPAVIWLSDDPARRRALRTAISGTQGLPDLFRVSSPGQYLADLHSTDTSRPPDGQKGGDPS